MSVEAVGTATVSAIQAREPGGPEVLTEAEFELPPLMDGQVRVRVTYAGVNYWDVMQREGKVPFNDTRIPGVEGTGVVSAVAADVDEPAPGTRVAWGKVPASYAQQVQGDASSFVVVPAEVTDEVAAAVLMQGVTAGFLREAAPLLGTGGVACVLAAAGGVGGLLTQLLVADGIRVCGVVSRADKVAHARSFGAETVLVDDDDLVDQLREAYPAGVDALFDGNGGPQVPRAFELLAPRGTLVVFGTAAGPLPSIELDELGRGSFSVTRVAGKHFGGDAATWRRRAEAIFERVRAGELAPHVDEVFALKEAAAAHERLESRRSRGKLLLRASGG